MVFFSYEEIKNGIKKILPNSLWLNLRTVLPSQKINFQIRKKLAKNWRSERKSSIQFNKPFGVNIIGYFRAATGLGEAARRTLSVIQNLDIPFTVIDFEEEVPEHQQFDFPLSDFSNEFQYQINLFHINPMRLPYLWKTFPHSALTEHYNIGIWYWELPEFPDEWCDAFDLVDEIWVASEFVRSSLKKKTNKPIFIIPPFIEVEYDHTLTRADFGLPDKKFLFLCAYDELSVQERKNPMGAIQSFKQAFSPQDESVGLVIKINNVLENRQQVEQLKFQLTDYKSCYFLEETYPRSKFNALLNLIDVFVSLHRSEGFGLIPAECMYLGKPVVMTNWSGNIDFMTESNCCPVDYQLISVGKNNGIYDPKQIWAEPNITQAAKYMETLRLDRNYYHAISSNAANYIDNHFSQVTIGNRIKESISYIIASSIK